MRAFVLLEQLVYARRGLPDLGVIGLRDVVEVVGAELALAGLEGGF